MKLDLSVIKTLCKRKNITVKEFAEAVGVTPVGVSRSIKKQRHNGGIYRKGL